MVIMAATSSLAGPSAVAHAHSVRFSSEKLAAADATPKEDPREAMIAHFRDYLLGRIQAVEEFACELHYQRESVSVLNMTEQVAGLASGEQGTHVEYFPSDQAIATSSRQGMSSQELCSQHNPFHLEPMLSCKKELKPVHHAARRIARAWRLSKWRRSFIRFSEMEGYVGSLAWLEPRNIVYGGELADDEDTRHWMLQRAGADNDKEVDPRGHHALMAHLLGLPLVEDNSIDKRLRLPQTRHKKPWLEHRLRRHQQVSALVAQLDETSQRRRLQRQQQQKQQQQTQQQQQQQQSLQGSVAWIPAQRQSLSAPRMLLRTGAATRSRASPAVVPKPCAHSQWLLGTITQTGLEGAAAEPTSAR